MVRLALILGLYSYAILGLGLWGRLSFLPVIVLSAIFVGVLIKTVKPLLNFQNILNFFRNEIIKDKVVLLCLLLLFLQAMINLAGAVSPELSFDALWYHLTEAKLYAGSGRIFPIKGELLWPSNLPRL
ncbi:MAG: hypothetical protein Q8N98_02590, partial [bacterium]|nr:hypothetical protein [bacterium]